jgi:type II secretory ATPase GspE/PulE/Tfp pilus assembly ATPase PilB-like protein
MSIFDFFGKSDKDKRPDSVSSNKTTNQNSGTGQVQGTNKGVASPQLPRRDPNQIAQTPMQRATATKPPPPQRSSPVRDPAPAPASVPAITGMPSKNIPTISRKDEIPQHSGVMSATGAPLELIPEWQKNYAILLTSKDRKDVIIVCSTEVAKSGGLDDDYLAILDRINRSEYIRTRRFLAKPEILAIIYEAGSGQKLTEEQTRSATKIQIDFDDLLRAAIKADTSDIHIEVQRDEAKVRFRKNGDLYVYSEWPVKYASTMGSVIYTVIADEKETTFDPTRPQSAIIDRELSGLSELSGDDNDMMRIRVRLNTLPTYPDGFDMVMRILKMGQGGKRTPLDKLGYEKRQLSQIRRAVAKPVGALIMAGTTGSGKSTSLNSMLGEKIDAYKGKLKVITVEDPPEYALPGASQVPVVRSRSIAKGGDVTANPFATVMSAAMRSDPDILMVGEVRDEDSAELLIHAVQSGHQVFTTVHASGPIDIIPRLRSIGVKDDVLGGQNFISALMYQTLLPTLCPKCCIGIDKLIAAVETDVEQELIERIHKYVKPQVISDLRFRHDPGCSSPDCAMGVIGRTVASEVILPDPYMLKCFRDRQDTEAFMHYRRKGGRIALEHGLMKAFRGNADIRDVEGKLDQITRLHEIDDSMRVMINVPLRANFQVEQDVFEEISFEALEARYALSQGGIAVPEVGKIILPEHVSPAEAAPAPAPVAKAPVPVIIDVLPEPVVEPVVALDHEAHQFTSKLFSQSQEPKGPKAEVKNFSAANQTKHNKTQRASEVNKDDKDE